MVMSKKTSPQSRPRRRPRTLRGGESTPATQGKESARAATRGAAQKAGQKAAQKKITPDKDVPTTVLGRFRRFLPTVGIPNIVVVLGIIVVALAGLMFTASPLTWLPAAIAQLWLILNAAPATIDGLEIGVVPLLPALGLVALIARRIRVAVRERVSVADLLVLTACTLVIPVVLTLIAAGMMWDAGRVFDVGAPPLADAVGRTLLLHATALVIGMGGRLWGALLRRYGAPDGLVDAAVVALRILGWLAVAAAVVMVILFIMSWPRQVEVAGVYNSTAAVVAVSILSVLYLPNAVISAVAVLLGSEFHIGAASVSLFAIDLVPLPPLPLLAIIPGTASQWAVILLVAVAGLTAYLVGSARLNLIQAVAAGVVAALVALVATELTSGQLAEFGDVGPMRLLTAGLALAWITGVGLVAAGVGKLADRRAPEPEAGVDADPQPDADTEPVDDGDDQVIDGEVIEDADDAVDADGADDADGTEGSEGADGDEGDVDTHEDAADAADADDAGEVEGVDDVEEPAESDESADSPESQHHDNDTVITEDAAATADAEDAEGTDVSGGTDGRKPPATD